jgi:hypothetical protein
MFFAYDFITLNRDVMPENNEETQKALKLQLEEKVEILRKRGITRRTISLALGKQRNYVSQALGPNGKVTLRSIEQLNVYFEQVMCGNLDEEIETQNAEEYSSQLTALDCAFQDCEFLYLAKGESMEPKIPTGTLVGIRRIERLDVIISGELYVIFTKNGLNCIRIVNTIADNPDAIELIAYNEKTRETQIKVSDIGRLYRAEFMVKPL